MFSIKAQLMKLFAKFIYAFLTKIFSIWLSDISECNNIKVANEFFLEIVD